ncbi:MAG: molybdopterin-binding protein [Nitrospira sp.]|nr:molybdopterin-binding protein [Nitrospira sp.]
MILPSPHEASDPAPSSIGCLVMTCHATRSAETDASGLLIQRLLTAYGHRVVGYQVVIGDPAQLQLSIARGTGHDAVQALLISDNTGLSRRDGMVDAVEAMLDKRLEGFGELFRVLTYHDLGSPAIRSHATAGIIKGRVLFAFPGSEQAIHLAMEKLILPELGPLMQQLAP